MNPIPLIEDFLGRDLNAQSAEELAAAPAERIAALMKDLECFYFDWLESAEQSNAARTEECLLCIDPVPQHDDWRKQLDYYKRCLLYMPRFAVTDPLSSVFKPAFTVAQLLGSFPDTAEFRKGLRDALALMAELAEAARNGDIVLLPWSFAVDYASVQDAVRKELSALDASPRADDYYGPIVKIIDESYGSGGTAVQSNELQEERQWLKKIYVGQAKVAGQLCLRLDLSPVAGSELMRTILQQEYLLQGARPVAQSVHATSTALARFEIPGIAAADLHTILSIRRHDTAFAEFRRNYARLMREALSQNPADQAQFEVEFRSAADDLLIPRIDELQKATRSSVLEKFLIPGAVSLGAAAIAYDITHTAAVSTLASAGLASGSWILDKLRKRYSSSGQKSRKLVEAYGLLMNRGTAG